MSSDIKTRTVSLDELIKAISLDGYEQGFNHLLNDTRGIAPEPKGEHRIITACAYGQAALNLNVDMTELTGPENELFAKVYFNVFDLNDRVHLNPKQIARRIKAKFKDSLKETITVPIAFYEELYSNYQGRKI